MSNSYDAIIIGAGHNGLVCGSYLAKAGLKVCLVERQPFVGGAAISREVWPGYKVSVASYWMSLLQPKIMLDLELLENGVEVITVPPSFHPFENGKSLLYWPEDAQFIGEVRRFSENDAKNYPKFVAHMNELMPFVRRLLFETPVDPTTGRLKDLKRAAELVWRMRDIGSRAHDIIELLTMNAHDYLRRWFESDEMLAAFGSYTAGSSDGIGPKSPASAFVLVRPLLRESTTRAGGGGLVKGGMGAISEALLRVATKHGAEIITGHAVKKVDIQNGRACGVVLDDGRSISAKVVISNTGAGLTYLDLIGRENLSEDVIGKIERFKTHSYAFKINLATKSLPRWASYDKRRLNEPNPGSVTIAESIAELEESFAETQKGGLSKTPYLWITTPSAFDDSIAPEGKHVVQIMGGHVPYHPRSGDWDDATRSELLDIVVGQICRYAPGFESEVLHAQVLTPPDIEKMFAMAGGHVHHGRMSLDQIFSRRPIAGFADHRTPIKGMYMCGAVTHPGGGVTGVPGHNAAREILGDLGLSFPARSKRYASCANL